MEIVGWLIKCFISSTRTISRMATYSAGWKLKSTLIIIYLALGLLSEPRGKLRKLVGFHGALYCARKPIFLVNIFSWIQKGPGEVVLFQQKWAIQCIDTAIYLVSRGDVIIFIRVIRLHQLDRLLKLVKVFSENRDTETIDEFCEVFDVFCKSNDSIRVDLPDIRRKRLSLWRSVSKQIANWRKPHEIPESCLPHG